MNILFLSRWFPYPADNGSKLRVLALLRGLAAEHRVTLLSFAEAAEIDAGMATMQSICDQVHVVPWRAYRPERASARFGYLSPIPRSFVDTFSTEMKQRIEHVLAAERFDIVIGSQLNALNYAQYLGGQPAILEESELGVFHSQYADKETYNARQRLRAGLTWFKLRHYMARQLRYFRAATVASTQERQLLADVAPAIRRVEVIPNCVDVTAYEGVHATLDPSSLIFTGSFRYRANHEAMTWFLRDVYPLVHHQVPGTTLAITGDHCNLPLPPGPNVTLTGYVDDVRPMIAGACCSIAPLRSGGGTRLKILEAMALGTPVVATSKGAEGLDAQDGVHLLIGDTPEAFANAVLRIMQEPGLRQTLAENGRQFIHSRYSWSNRMPLFLDLVAWAASDAAAN